MADLFTYGTFKKINVSTGQELGTYTYGDILLHLSKRIRLRKELADNPESKLYCSCCPERRLELRVSETHGLAFVNKTQHTDDCSAYLRALSHFISLPGIAPFTGKEVGLPVSFQWVKGSRSSVAFVTGNCLVPQDGPLSLNAFAAIINIRAFELRERQAALAPAEGKEEADFWTDALFELGKYRVVDSKKREWLFDRNAMFHGNQTPGAISFVYARIIEIKDTFKTNVFLYCEHAGGRSNFCVGREKWDRLIKGSLIAGLPLSLFGFVATREVDMFEPALYNKKSHQFYKPLTRSKRREHYLTSFVVFHTNDFGLICFSQNEYRIGNELSRRGVFYSKPYYPLPGTTALPPFHLFND